MVESCNTSKSTPLESIRFLKTGSNPFSDYVLG